MEDNKKTGSFISGVDPEDIDVEKNISDFAGIIESGYADKIDRVISEIERKTSVEIAVITIGSLKGKSIDEMALRLFNKFGVGKKDENNGVMFLISRDDNQFRIEIGLGLEDIIDDGLQRKLIDNLISPNFKNRRFGKPILRFVRAISDRIRRGRISRLSIVSWLSGILCLIFGAAGIFSSVVITFDTYIDIYSTSPLVPLFAKTTSPAAILALVAIVFGTIDIIRDKMDRAVKYRTIKSVWGIIFGILTLALITVIFYVFPRFILFLAGTFSLATGMY